MNSPSDQLLVEQARKGSQRAFAQLVERYQGFVYSLCVNLSGGGSEAEDLAQESFLRLYRSLGSFRLDSPLRPWLRRIATNVCVDSLRRRQAETMPLEEVLGSAAEPRSRFADELPEEAALTRESREYVRDQIRALPADYRAALVLRYLEDLSYREIAEALGVSVSAVETRLYRARRALSRALSPPPADGRAAGRFGLEAREDRDPGREGFSHDVQVDRSGIL